MYIEHALEGGCKKYDVDCEYNRILNLVKRVHIETYKGWLKSHGKSDSRKDVPKYPDIIVHKRRTMKDNLICIEIKKSTNKDDPDYDRYKLEEFTKKDGDLEYQYGVFIMFYIGKRDDIGYEVQYYHDGKEVPEWYLKYPDKSTD